MAGKKLIDLVPEEVESTQSKPTVNLDRLRTKNIFFATPCYGGQLTDQYYLSMFRVTQELTRLNIPYRITTLRNESLIPRARNILAAMFLDSGCSHLMFIDADIEFEPDAIVRMLSHERDLIVGAYPKKTVDWESVRQAALRGEKDISTFGAQYAINFKYKDLGNRTLNFDRGVVEVIDASTGFFMIAREVFDKMMVAYPDLHYKNDTSIDPKLQKYCYAFFDTFLDKKDGRYLSEDYAFCRLWQQLGGKIWLDPETNLNHVGAFTYPGAIKRLFPDKK